MSSEKTEQPTPQKLDKARKEGQIPKSQETAAITSFAFVLMALAAASDWMADRLKGMMASMLTAVASPLPDAWLVGLGMQVFLLTLGLILPLAAVAALGGAIGMLMQVGVQVSFKPVTPKFDAINPVNGFKKVISWKSLLEGLQMVLRAIIIGVVVWSVIRSALPMISGAAYHAPSHIGATAWSLFLKLMFVTLVVCALMGPLDYALQRWQFMKGQRMSKDEIKREFKEGEGDPQLKGERKQLAREMIENPPPPGQGAPVKVVVANPTHCAVALAWRPGMVPVVVARGEDRQAVALRETAEAEGVAVFTNRSLARRLVQLPRGSAISADTFEAVGAILRCIAGIEALAPASAREPAA